MARNVKLVAVVALLVLGLLFLGPAAASISTGPAPDYYLGTTISGWRTDVDVTQQDKDWHFLSSNLPSTMPVSFQKQVIDGQDNHILTIGDTQPDVPITTGTFTLDYTISIIAGGGPGVSFNSVSLADTASGTGVSTTITKTLYNQSGVEILPSPYTLVSVNGASDSTTAVNGLTYLKVDEVFTVTHGEIEATTNTFVQNSIPEPISLGVWTLLGACGVTIGWWRRKRAA
jgi:hypothetical protein